MSKTISPKLLSSDWDNILAYGFTQLSWKHCSVVSLKKKKKVFILSIGVKSWPKMDRQNVSKPFLGWYYLHFLGGQLENEVFYWYMSTCIKYSGSYFLKQYVAQQRTTHAELETARPLQVFSCWTACGFGSAFLSFWNNYAALVDWPTLSLKKIILIITGICSNSKRKISRNK